jgi:hypothetical protein
MPTEPVVASLGGCAELEHYSDLTTKIAAVRAVPSK